MSTFVLAFVFVFGNAIRNTFEAILFLFVIHPFDVGDRVFVGVTGPMFVHEIGMLTTVMANWDKKLIYFPNS